MRVQKLLPVQNTSLERTEAFREASASAEVEAHADASAEVTNTDVSAGHEITGTVVAVGDDAKHVQVGDSGIVFPWIG